MTNDPYNLQRFVEAQDPVYADVLAELKVGRKATHWMWFVFPQLAGLGQSRMSVFYSIASQAEADAYLAHPVLGPRLRECTKLVIEADAARLEDIFGTVDSAKFRSCMSLFRSEPLCAQSLDRYSD